MNTPLPGDRDYKPDPNYNKIAQPNDIGGYQCLVAGEPTKAGDIWVSEGRPRGFVDISAECGYPTVPDTSTSNYILNWHIYRKMPQPGHHQPDVVQKLAEAGLKPTGCLSSIDPKKWEYIPDGSGARVSFETKPSNPKDLVGSDKIPLHLWPTTASALGSLALLDGMLKYGRSNFRVVGVRATIYYDALNRHMNAWIEGEDLDPDSGLPHLAHALACLAVIIDADSAGKLTDDRLVAGGYRQHVESLTPHVKRLKEKHKDKDPKHYTISDKQPLAGYQLCG